jgi:hypothetical protein
VAKLSSASTKSAASLAASVPFMPIATPTSARFSAGASLTPSPVIATTWPAACSACTRRSLCSGLARANTSVSSATFRSCSSSRFSISVPLKAALPGPMPSRSPIACAVSTWSPVIILTRMPAPAQVATAVNASSRGGSMMPARASRVWPPSRSAKLTSRQESSANFPAIARTRKPPAANSFAQGCQ